MRSKRLRVVCKHLRPGVGELSYAGAAGRRRRPAYVCRKEGAPNYGVTAGPVAFFARCRQCPENAWDRGEG